MPSPEHGPRPESNAENLPRFEVAPERKDEQLEQRPERETESTERTIEAAKAEANKEAISGREVSRGEEESAKKDAAPLLPRMREESYKRTMHNVQSEMSAPARAFSRVIHNAAVERVSDVVGGSVARPNAILSGSVFAFALVLALYLLARYDGFSLSGFETIATFIIGWILGIVFDFLRVMITGKNQ